MSNRRQEAFIHPLQQRQVEKYSYADEQEALTWIEDVLDEGKLFNSGQGMKMIGDALRDGIYLCKLIKKLQPEISMEICKPEDESTCKENIERFLDKCQKCGIPKEDLFESSNLYDGTNLYRVVKAIISIKTKFLPNNYDKQRYLEENPHPVTEKQFCFPNQMME